MKTPAMLNLRRANWSKVNEEIENKMANLEIPEFMTKKKQWTKNCRNGMIPKKKALKIISRQVPQ